MRGKETLVYFLLASILVGFLPAPISQISDGDFTEYISEYDYQSVSLAQDEHMGDLNPVLIEHRGTTNGMTTFSNARTDVTEFPYAETWLPVGGSSNRHSAECSGGYFLVGENGMTSFSSSKGTISFWLKFHQITPNRKIWGQDDDYEIRLDNNRINLDWGNTNSLQSSKTDWGLEHWYFIAVTWDQNNDSLSIYWGDETTAPLLDSAIYSWFDNVIGIHTANCIMNSLSQPNSEVRGNIDDFRFYDIQRSLTQIRSDYLIQTAETYTHLQHWYRFESDLSDSIGVSNLEQIGNWDFSWDVVSTNMSWIAEQVEINVDSIDRLYALNGTFDNGNPGTNVDWSDDGQYFADGWLARREVVTEQGRQRSAYISSDSNYLMLENEGFEIQSPTRYRHYNATQIYWYQNVDNNLLEDEFEFCMKYNYLSGPIGSHYSNSFQLKFEILYESSVLWNWSIDPTNITSRGTWFSVPKTDLILPFTPSSFQIRICLAVQTASSYVEIGENDSDLDGDSANGQFIRFLLDDVSLTSIESPTSEEVDLQVSFPDIGIFSFQSCLGGCTVFVNHSYWTTASIRFSFQSNTSISFDYSAKVSLMKKFTNSSYSPNLENQGVAFFVEQNTPVRLMVYTYIESYPEATNLGFIVHHPNDWSHTGIIDPFGSSISQYVIIETDKLELPMGFVDSVGWWKITMESTNYLYDLKTQTVNMADWIDSSVFHCNEMIRSVAKLGTSNESIHSMTNITFEWRNPAGVLWSSELIELWNQTDIVSNVLNLVTSNTTIGDWYVSLKWQNGTEVAYGSVPFQLYHRLNVFPQTPSIEINHGEGFLAAINVYDFDIGVPILSEATVIGNWSNGDITFHPNLAKSWYEVELNSSDIGPGTYVIRVDVSISYYESNTCVMTIEVFAPESILDVAIRAGFVTAIALLSLIGISYTGRRVYVSRVTKNNLELLSLRGRLEDAMNLIGILVIHRASGLPIYSRIFKGVFQEALLSSFISAISQFRSQVSTKIPLWAAIPISDVVTAVQTENMICAVVTNEEISEVLKDRLESFSHEVGFLYDNDDNILNVVVARKAIEEKFEAILVKHFDIAILQRYIGIKSEVPDRLNTIVEVMTSIDISNGITVYTVINEVIRRGIPERYAYHQVFDAIDGGYLIPAVEGD